MKKPINVLIIATAHEKMGDTIGRAGVWLEDLAAPYYTFKEAGALVTIAAIAGGAIPLEPKSQALILATQHTKRFLKDEEAMSLLLEAAVMENLASADFDLVYLPGGHGVFWDLAGSIALSTLLASFNQANKPIGAVSHGIAGLLSVKNENGELLVRGKHLTCSSDGEEESAGLALLLPFLLESRLVSLEAIYTKGPAYTSHVVIDGNIITGQNPASAAAVAKELIAMTKYPLNIPVPAPLYN